MKALKALTIRQPWAWAIAHGGKTIENRSWLTHHRGLLAIHAAARWDGLVAHRQVAALTGEHIDNIRIRPERMGAVVAVVDLTDVCATRTDHDCGCGGWAAYGLCHWRVANPRPLAEPVPCKGRLGLWELPPAVEIAVLDQLQGAAR